MPIGFVVFGILFLYFCFYFSKQKIIPLICCFLFCCSYLFLPLTFTKFSINIFIVLPLLIMFVYMFAINKKYSFVYLSILFNFCYVFIVKINSDYLTIFNPFVASVILIIVSMFVGDKMALIHYYCLSYILMLLTNIALEQPMGFVNIATVDVLSFVIVSFVISEIIIFLLNQIKLLIRRKI